MKGIHLSVQNRQVTLLIYLALWCVPNIVWAQRVLPEKYRVRAEALALQYPDASEVNLKSSSIYSFQRSKRSDIPVSATQKTNYEVMSTEDNNAFKTAIFYNAGAGVNKVIARSRKGKMVDPRAIYTNYLSSGIFHDDVKICIINYDLDTKGETFTYGYEKRYEDIKFLTSVYFHEQSPVLEKEIVFEVPDWLEIDFHEINFKDFEVSKSKINNAKQGTTTYTFSAKNLPAFKKDSNSPGIAYDYPHLVVLAKGVISDGKKQKLLASSDDLYAWYSSLVNELENDNDQLIPLVESLIGESKSDIEKVASIFYWVQDNIRYIAFEEGIMGFKPEASHNVYSNRYGDCKGMANLTKQMLTLAGFDARLVWLGTNSIPYDYNIPSLIVDNHMICAVKLDDTWEYLDATETFIGLGDYAERIQGRQVMIENGEQYILENVPELDYTRNLLSRKIKMSIVDKSLKGNETFSLNGERKTSFLRQFSALKTNKQDEALSNYLSKHDKNLHLERYSNSNLSERSGLLQFDFDFLLNNQIVTVGDEIYVNIDRYKEFSSVNFEKDRTRPYDFNNKVFLLSETVLEIPKGYRVKYLPVGMNEELEDFSFSVNFEQIGNNIISKKQIAIRQSIIDESKFSTWNSTIDKVKSAYNDQIILIKK